MDDPSGTLHKEAEALDVPVTVLAPAETLHDPGIARVGSTTRHPTARCSLAAVSLHLAFFGVATGAVALAVGAGTGRRALATGAGVAFAVIGFLLNGLAPLVNAIVWLKYFSPFYYYAEHDPLTNGVDIGDLAVLGLFAAALTAAAMVGFRRRDLLA